jgi:hypothetical protein
MSKNDVTNVLDAIQLPTNTVACNAYLMDPTPERKRQLITVIYQNGIDENGRPTLSMRGCTDFVNIISAIAGDIRSGKGFTPETLQMIMKPVRYRDIGIQKWQREQAAQEALENYTLPGQTVQK